MNIRPLITKLTSPQLTKLAENTSVKIKQLKDKYVFQSKTMQELFTDIFEYKGNEKNIIYLKNRTTGKPAPVIVEIFNTPYLSKNDLLVEDINLYDINTKQLIAHKHYYIKTLKNEKVMYQGEMETYSSDYIGAGIRLDQIQIARALEQGIQKIPRTAYPQAIIFHLKMGFLPNNLNIGITSKKELNKYIKKICEQYRKYIPNKYIEPLVTENKGNFYLEKNWTITKACIQKCEDILDTSNPQIRNFDDFPIFMTLDKEELTKWKTLIEKHPILDKLSFQKNLSNTHCLTKDVL